MPATALTPDPPAFDGFPPELFAFLRELERWLAETEGATVDEVQDLAQALVHLDDAHMCTRLAAIFDARAQRSLKRISDQWAPTGATQR